MSRNCAEDLTSVDLDHVNASTLSLSSTLSSSTISLYPFIWLDQSTALNVDDPSHLSLVVRPYDTKDVVKSNDEIDTHVKPPAGGCLSSQADADDNDVLIRIRFSELVKVKSVVIGTGGGRVDSAPKRVRLFVNRSTAIGFDEAANDKAEQEFELLENINGQSGSTEYPLRLSKFSNVNALDLYFVSPVASCFIPPCADRWRMQSGARADQAVLYYLGFMGESRVLKKEPGEAMTIGAENAVHRSVDGVRDEKRLPDAVR